MGDEVRTYGVVSVPKSDHDFSRIRALNARRESEQRARVALLMRVGG